MRKNLVSVIVVNHNGVKYITKCVTSIFASATKQVEVIVVDNASTDSSIKALKKAFTNKVRSKALQIIELKQNYGPARARNEGVAASSGEFLCFLDNDTVVEKNWAQEAKKLFKKNAKVGIIQCKLLLSDKKTIDYIGEYMSSNGFLVQKVRGGTLDDGSFDKTEPILAAKSAGMFMRRVAFEQAGGFDSDYFIYVEETDLGWRSWLMGYKNIFLPSSIVYHDSGTSTLILGSGKVKQLARFHGSKNYILTHLKNLDNANLFKILPLHSFLWICLALFCMARGRLSEGYWIFRGIGWNILHLGDNLQKRNTIQSVRKISDEKLFKIWMKDRPLSYFFKKVVDRHQVGNAKSY